MASILWELVTFYAGQGSWLVSTCGSNLEKGNKTELVLDDLGVYINTVCSQMDMHGQKLTGVNFTGKTIFFKDMSTETLKKEKNLFEPMLQ